MKINSAIWDRFDMEKEDIENIVKDYVHNYKISDIIFTGHSLGGALAQLTGNFCNFPSTNKHCITFGAPYVGDIAFKRDIETNINDIQRVVIKRDIVPQIKFNKVLVHNGNDRIYNFKSNVPFPINLYENHKSINYLKCVKGIH
jgi:predicted lipase